MSVAQSAEQLPVLLGRAEQLADDRDRVGLADVGDELALARAGERVDQTADDLAHERAQPVGGLGRERGRDEPAEPRVLVALRGQDRRPAPHRIRVGTDHLGHAGEGLMPTPVAEQGDAVLVAEDRVAAHVGAGDPALLARGRERASALLLVLDRHEFDVGDVEVGERSGHDVSVRGR